MLTHAVRLINVATCCFISCFQQDQRLPGAPLKIWDPIEGGLHRTHFISHQQLPCHKGSWVFLWSPWKPSNSPVPPGCIWTSLSLLSADCRTILHQRETSRNWRRDFHRIGDECKVSVVQFHWSLSFWKSGSVKQTVLSFLIFIINLRWDLPTYSIYLYLILILV